MEYLSKQRYDEISAELKHLINVVYPKVKDDLAEARAQGDLSENAGYREARRIQAKTISRIRFLQKVLEHSRVIDPDVLPKDKVGLLSVYAWIVGLAMLSWVFLRSVACDYFSLGLGPIVACIALGAFLGQRSRKQ